MTDADSREEVRHRLDIVRLLDERFRLREDPESQTDLQLTHERLREELRHLTEGPDESSTSNGEPAGR